MEENWLIIQNDPLGDQLIWTDLMDIHGTLESFPHRMDQVGVLTSSQWISPHVVNVVDTSPLDLMAGALSSSLVEGLSNNYQNQGFIGLNLTGELMSGISPFDSNTSIIRRLGTGRTREPS
jgi:hypothetical protein